MVGEEMMDAPPDAEDLEASVGHGLHLQRRIRVCQNLKDGSGRERMETEGRKNERSSRHHRSSRAG